MVTFTKGLRENEELANDEGVKMVRQLQDAKGNIDGVRDDMEILEGVNVEHDETKKNKNTKNAIEKDKKSLIEEIQQKYSEDKFLNQNNENEGGISESIYEEVDISGNDTVDTYKSVDENEFDLEYLIKNCKQRFVTGGSYVLENESDDEDGSGSEKEKNKDKNAQEQEIPQEEAVSPEEAQAMLNQKIKPFLSDSNTYGLFQLGSYIRIDLKKIKRKWVEKGRKFRQKNKKKIC